MKTFTDGKIIGSGVSDVEYHRQEFRRGDRRFVMSRSELCDFIKCPSKWLRGSQSQDDTDATEYGSLVDCLVTQPTRFDERYIIKPDTYINDKGESLKWTRAAKICKKWEDDNGHLVAIKNDTIQGARTAVERLVNDSFAGELIQCSQKQVMATAIYNDRATGLQIPIKVLIDLVPDALHSEYGQDLGDLKTCRDASPFAFKWAAYRSGYHVQSALYLDVYNAATVPDDERNGWLLVLSENVSPYEPATRWLDMEMIQRGRDIYLYALGLYCQCLKRNEWPGYDSVGSDIRPGWGQISLDAKMIESFPRWFNDEPAEQQTTNEPDPDNIP